MTSLREALERLPRYSWRPPSDGGGMGPDPNGQWLSRSAALTSAPGGAPPSQRMLRELGASRYANEGDAPAPAHCSVCLDVHGAERGHLPQSVPASLDERAIREILLTLYGKVIALSSERENGRALEPFESDARFFAAEYARLTARAAATEPLAAPLDSCVCQHPKVEHYFGDRLGDDGRMHSWCQMQPPGHCTDYRRTAATEDTAQTYKVIERLDTPGNRADGTR